VVCFWYSAFKLPEVVAAGPRPVDWKILTAHEFILAAWKCRPMFW